MDITEIIALVFRLILVILTGMVIPAFSAWIKTKTTAEQRKTFSIVCDTFVSAAEQIYKSEEAEAKKDYVYEHLWQWAREHGCDYDELEINDMIEASVLELHTALKEALND